MESTHPSQIQISNAYKISQNTNENRATHGSCTQLIQPIAHKHSDKSETINNFEFTKFELDKQICVNNFIKRDANFIEKSFYSPKVDDSSIQIQKSNNPYQKSFQSTQISLNSYLKTNSNQSLCGIRGSSVFNLDFKLDDSRVQSSKQQQLDCDQNLGKGIIQFSGIQQGAFNSNFASSNQINLQKQNSLSSEGVTSEQNQNFQYKQSISQSTPNIITISTDPENLNFQKNQKIYSTHQQLDNQQQQINPNHQDFSNVILPVLQENLEERVVSKSTDNNNYNIMAISQQQNDIFDQYLNEVEEDGISGAIANPFSIKGINKEIMQNIGLRKDVIIKNILRDIRKYYSIEFNNLTNFNKKKRSKVESMLDGYLLEFVQANFPNESATNSSPTQQKSNHQSQLLPPDILTNYQSNLAFSLGCLIQPKRMLKRKDLTVIQRAEVTIANIRRGCKILDQKKSSTNPQYILIQLQPYDCQKLNLQNIYSFGKPVISRQQTNIWESLSIRQGGLGNKQSGYGLRFQQYTQSQNSTFKAKKRK
eukprot:403358122